MVESCSRYDSNHLLICKECEMAEVKTRILGWVELPRGRDGLWAPRITLAELCLGDSELENWRYYHWTTGRRKYRTGDTDIGIADNKHSNMDNVVGKLSFSPWLSNCFQNYVIDRITIFEFKFAPVFKKDHLLTMKFIFDRIFYINILHDVLGKQSLWPYFVAWLFIEF